ncbi:MarR family winged helix-turn-helix transcriptional regulator (plasmid) [Paraburkholderia strydomiana]
MKYEGYGFVFTRAARFISRIYNRHLVDVKLTVSQYGILAALGHCDSVALQDLADRLVIERSALLRMVRPLIKAGLVRSTIDVMHKRRLLYRLTEEGHLRLESASAFVHSAESEIERIFARSEILVIRDSLLPVANAARDEVNAIL